ncbi:MAG: tetratricopeptide repeat protein [Verrucomicrobiota bacterium]
MRRQVGTILGLAVLLGGSGLMANETAVTRLERGVALMADESKLKDAIREFEGVLLAESKSKKLGAEARYRIAKCYLDLGDEEKAKKQVEKLKEEYDGENRWVKKAVGLLAAGIPFQDVPWVAGEFFEYEIQLPNGEKAGSFYITIQEHEFEGEETWVSMFTRAGDNLMQTRVDFLKDNLRPVEADGYSNLFGSVEMEFEEDGAWRMRRLPSGEFLRTAEAKAGGWAGSPFYENDQTMQLMRMIPTEVGTEVTMPLLAALQGGDFFDFEIKAVAHETITVPAGEFECVKYETNIQQTFWVALEGARPIVKMGLGMASVVLMDTDEVWDWREPLEHGVEVIGGEVITPEGAIYVSRRSNEKRFKMRFTDGRFRFQVGDIEVWDNSKRPKEEGKSGQELIEWAASGIGKHATSFELDEDAWKTVEVGEDLEGTFGRGHLKLGELETERTFLVVRGPKKTLVLHLDHLSSRTDQVEELMMEMAKSWKR